LTLCCQADERFGICRASHCSHNASFCTIDTQPSREHNYATFAQSLPFAPQNGLNLGSRNEVWQRSESLYLLLRKA
jgi:hypothetical protein